MKAKISFSNGQTVTFEGVQSLEHAGNVANITACRFSASYGKAVYPESIVIDSQNFAFLSSPEYWMEGVQLVSSVGG